MLTGIKAIIKQEDKFLLLHKADNVPRFPGFWDFPGGTLEDEESPAEGILREVKEETSLDIKGFKQVWTGIIEVEGKPIKYIIFESQEFSGKVELSHEHTEFRWLAKQELLKLKIQPYIRRYFEEI